jgi:8-oxo-dGTP pyrophosphatase MutT (NUDIX family)
VALGRLRAPFDRDAGPTHVTGSALILRPEGILLHRHKRLGIWVQPGGHLEPGEFPWDAARREGEEETGLRLSWPGSGPEGGIAGAPPLAHLDVHAGGQGHTHLDLRYVLAVVGPQAPAPPVSESQAVRWFAWSEAAAIADAGLAGFVRRQTGRRSAS